MGDGFEFKWQTTAPKEARPQVADRSLTDQEMAGFKSVYMEETEGKRLKGGGGKNDNAGKAKNVKRDWRSGRDSWNGF